MPRATKAATTDVQITVTTEIRRPTYEDIAARAYAIYLEHGQDGRDVENWLQAERELTGVAETKTVVEPTVVVRKRASRTPKP